MKYLRLFESSDKHQGYNTEDENLIFNEIEKYVYILEDEGYNVSIVRSIMNPYYVWTDKDVLTYMRVDGYHQTSSDPIEYPDTISEFSDRIGDLVKKLGYKLKVGHPNKIGIHDRGIILRTMIIVGKNVGGGVFAEHDYGFSKR